LKIRPRNSKPTANVVRIAPSDPDTETIAEADKVLRREGVLIFPTTGLYGLGVDVFCDRAVRRVFAIKQRPADKPVLVLLSGLQDMDRLVRKVPEHARSLLELWPGGITFIFSASDEVPVELTGGTGTIGVRLPAHPVARALTDCFGGPITGTSANISGHPAASSITMLSPEIRRQVDMVMDAGPLAGGPGSTIVDVTVWPVKVLRQGAVSMMAIERILK
jgi:L-threonylcarbamoyladenylate synthase